MKDKENARRSYQLAKAANPGKLKAVADIFPVWQKAMTDIEHTTMS